MSDQSCFSARNRLPSVAEVSVMDPVLGQWDKVVLVGFVFWDVAECWVFWTWRLR